MKTRGYVAVTSKMETAASPPTYTWEMSKCHNYWHWISIIPRFYTYNFRIFLRYIAIPNQPSVRHRNNLVIHTDSIFHHIYQIETRNRDERFFIEIARVSAYLDRIGVPILLSSCRDCRHAHLKSKYVLISTLTEWPNELNSILK